VTRRDFTEFTQFSRCAPRRFRLPSLAGTCLADSRSHGPRVRRGRVTLQEARNQIWRSLLCEHSTLVWSGQAPRDGRDETLLSAWTTRRAKARPGASAGDGLSPEPSGRVAWPAAWHLV
jgi:hypothetical protein